MNSARNAVLMVAAALLLVACTSTASRTGTAESSATSSTTAAPVTSGSPAPPSASTRVPSSPTAASPPSGSGSDYWLSDFNAAQSILTNTWGDAERINGTAYLHTVVIQESVTVTDPIGGSWDLARQCSTLSFKAAGLVDMASDPGARLVFAVTTDGRERWRQELAFGATASLANLDISNTLRLNLTTTDVGPVTTRAEGGFGDVVVHCSAEPPNSRS